MLSGGASSDEAIAIQEVAADRTAIHMMGFVPGNSLGGSECNAVGFQEMFNAKMAAQALRAPLIDEFGADVGYVQVRPRSDLGVSFESAVREEMGSDWTELSVVETRTGTRNFEGPIEQAAEEEPDVVFLDYYGLDGAHALRQSKQILGEEVGHVVPLYNRSMASNAASAIEDVIGTVHWHPVIRTPLSLQVIEAWSAEHAGDQQYSRQPSDLVHLAYSQLFQYAAAVQRAGSFEPPAVVSELEGFSYDLGMGEETMRACDHRADRPIPVVRGLSSPDELFGRYYQAEEVAEDVGYGCDEPPAADCEMGTI